MTWWLVYSQVTGYKLISSQITQGTTMAWCPNKTSFLFISVPSVFQLKFAPISFLPPEEIGQRNLLKFATDTDAQMMKKIQLIMAWTLFLVVFRNWWHPHCILTYEMSSFLFLKSVQKNCALNNLRQEFWSTFDEWPPARVVDFQSALEYEKKRTGKKAKVACLYVALHGIFSKRAAHIPFTVVPSQMGNPIWRQQASQ